MKTWYSIVAPGAARASFSSLRKWVCTESSSYPKGKRKEEMGLKPGHRHRMTGEERVAHTPQGRLQSDKKRSGNLPAHLDINEDGLHVLRLEESL